MPRRPAHSPTLPRPSSMDSLCLLSSEDLSLVVDQPAALTTSSAAVAGILHTGSTADPVELPSATNSPTPLSSIDPETPVHQSKSFGWRTPPFHRNKWIWEIICILFSITCLAAITILLSRLDGTWSSQWTFLLQPSTTLSILITAAQSSMIVTITEVLSQLKWLQISLPNAQSPPLADLMTFDSPSRGPLGSLKLLYLWKPHSRILPPMVYTACLLTITSIAMGPFTQQLISIRADNLVPTDGIVSTIAVTNYYNSDPGQDGPSLFSTPYKDISLDPEILYMEPDIQRAFYNGYYNLGKSLIDFNCPSSNCSWPTFNSLGICNTCQDVTNISTMTVQTNRDANITTPGGWSFLFGRWDKVMGLANGEFPRSAFRALPIDSLSARMVSMVITQAPDLILVEDPSRYLVVTECSISWCAKEYRNFTVVNGTLQQDYSIRDVALRPVAGQALGGLNISTASGWTSTTDNWVFMLTPDPDGGNVSTPFPPFQHGGLNVSIHDHIALSSDLARKFNVTGKRGSVLFSDGQDVGSTLSNITDSITNMIMRSGHENTALGVVWRQESTVEVHWEWLALPLAVVLCTAILFASMIVASWHYDVPQWKSSPLPLLFHGIQDWNDEEEHDLKEGRLEKLCAMEDRARSRKIRLCKSVKGNRWLAE